MPDLALSPCKKVKHCAAWKPEWRKEEPHSEREKVK
jgi:hypothetical protein